jgi:hypothetical protein|tara:strand:- start:2089 stop:2262 length:174 start_codon:yes stop_codon:yes gene_type:complete
MKTEYIELTEMWNQGNYVQVGDIMREEQWETHRVAEFCSYFAKYIGLNQLNILYKFL